MKLVPDLWAGTEQSLNDLVALEEKLLAMSQSELQAAMADNMDPVDLGYEVLDGGIAVVQISGNLISQSSWISKLFGLTSYTDLRAALLSAAADTSVSKVLLMVSSPGGAVMGIDQVTDAVDQVKSAGKPVVTYTTSAMCSAAYWIGCCADEVYASGNTAIGSIGVLQVLQNTAEAAKAEGVQTTVLRSGKYKAIGNPYEVLTKSDQEYLQSQLDAYYQLFVDHVAAHRNATVSAVDSKMAQGRVFNGYQAASVGLVDSVVGMSDLVKKMGAMRGPQHVEVVSMNQHTPAPQASEAPATTQEPAAQEPSLVEHLKAEIQAKDAKILALTVDLTQAKAASAQVVEPAGFADLTAIAAESLNTMLVALGQGAKDFAAVSAADLVAEHAKVKADFVAKFPVGGVASASTGDQQESVKAVDLASHRTLVNAVM